MYACDRSWSVQKNNRKRKQYRAAEKASIIRRHLIEKQSVANLCDEYGIAPSLYYRWQKQFFEGGEKAFATTAETAVSQLHQEVSQLEAKHSLRTGWASTAANTTVGSNGKGKKISPMAFNPNSTG